MYVFVCVMFNVLYVLGFVRREEVVNLNWLSDKSSLVWLGLAWPGLAGVGLLDVCMCMYN